MPGENLTRIEAQQRKALVDLARRKLLPGLFHLTSAGFIPGCRIIGVSLDDLDAEGFRKAARSALDEFSSRKIPAADWDAFAASLDYVPLAAGAAALRAAVLAAEACKAAAKDKSAKGGRPSDETV